MQTKLRDAIAVLDERGWLKNQSVDDRGRMCMHQALVWVHGEVNDGYKRDANAFCQVVREQFPGRPVAARHIVGFNDHTDTTYDDIKLVVTKAAMKVEETVE